VQVLKEDVRDKIGQAAVECFKDVGYEKASMRQIAGKAGLSVGNLYRYFPNKEALFEYCVAPAIDFFQNSMTNPEKSPGIKFIEFNMTREIDTIASIIEAHMVDKDALYILLLKNTGSKYENTKHTFIEFVKLRTLAFTKREFGKVEDDIVSQLYVEAAAAAFVEGFLVLLEKAPDNQSFIRAIIQYMELNVQAIIRYVLDVRDNKIEFRRINHEEIYRHFSSHCGGGSSHISESGRSDE